MNSYFKFDVFKLETDFAPATYALFKVSNNIITSAGNFLCLCRYNNKSCIFGHSNDVSFNILYASSLWEDFGR